MRLVLVSAISMATIAAAHTGWALAIAAFFPTITTVAVMLPAVWSNDGQRRLDARAILIIVLQWAYDVLELLLRRKGDR